MLRKGGGDCDCYGGNAAFEGSFDEPSKAFAERVKVIKPNQTVVEFEGIFFSNKFNNHHEELF